MRDRDSEFEKCLRMCRILVLTVFSTTPDMHLLLILINTSIHYKNNRKTTIAPIY